MSVGLIAHTRIREKNVPRSVAISKTLTGIEFMSHIEIYGKKI